MKIAFCTDGIFPLSVGGMQRHSNLLIIELSKYDFDISVFHPHKEKLFSNYKNVSEIYIEDINRRNNYLIECYKYSERIYNYLKEMPEHIIYSQGLSVWFGIKKLKNKIIVNPHGLESYQALSIKDKFIAIPFKMVFNYIFNNVDFVVSLGGLLTNILESLIPKSKIVVFPNGININENKIVSKKSSELIELLFVGRFASNKGIDLLLNVAKELNEEGYADKIIYRLAGKGPLWEKLKEHFALPNVQYLGFVTDEQLFEEYQSANAFVLPTLFEGMPTVVLEAMSFSLPIIVSNVGATAEMVDASNGYLLERNNKSALKNAIILFAGLNDKDRLGMGEASLSRVKNNFLWEVVAKKHFDLFKSINSSHELKIKSHS